MDKREEKEVIFVFGSNLAGRHGKGAALDARQKYGAVYGIGRGPTGKAYAIPTKGYNLEVLSLVQIQEYVKEFLTYAKSHTDTKQFYVTRIGCGLAGYTESEIAPFFKDSPDNCQLPEGWR